MQALVRHFRYRHRKQALSPGTFSSNPIDAETGKGTHKVLVVGDFPGHIFLKDMMAQGGVQITMTENDLIQEPYHNFAFGILALLDRMEGLAPNTLLTQVLFHDKIPASFHNNSGGGPAANDAEAQRLNSELVIVLLDLFCTDDAQIVPNGLEASVFCMNFVVPKLAELNRLCHVSAWTLQVNSSEVPRPVTLRHFTVCSRGWSTEDETLATVATFALALGATNTLAMINTGSPNCSELVS